MEDVGPIDLLVNDAGIFTDVSFFEADEMELDKYESLLHHSDTSSPHRPVRLLARSQLIFLLHIVLSVSSPILS